MRGKEAQRMHVERDAHHGHCHLWPRQQPRQNDDDLKRPPIQADHDHRRHSHTDVGAPVLKALFGPPRPGAAGGILRTL